MFRFDKGIKLDEETKLDGEQSHCWHIRCTWDEISKLAIRGVIHTRVVAR